MYMEVKKFNNFSLLAVGNNIKSKNKKDNKSQLKHLYKKKTDFKTVFKKCLIAAFIILFLISCLALVVNNHVKNFSSNYIIDINSNEFKSLPQYDTILVLGAGVYSNGDPTAMLRDRLDTSVEVFNSGKSPKILASGDHGRKNYNEVKAMKNYLIENDIDSKNIFMDHAGFSTYESIYRAKEIFKSKKILIVTQEYHLSRAIYCARKLGLEAYGISANKQDYIGMSKYKLREVAARFKDFIYVHILKPEPTFLGEPIPIINGDGDVTNDE